MSELLDKLMKKAEEGLRLLAADHPKELHTIFHAITADGQTIIAPAVYRSEVEKQFVLLNVKKLFREKDVVAYVTISESWLTMHNLKPGQSHHEFRPDVMPRNDPQRIEVVILMGTDGYTKTGKMFHILRDKRGRISDLEERLEPAQAFAGRFFNLLDWRKPGQNC